jgi:hypothetical protein
LGVLFPKVYIFNTKDFTLPVDGGVNAVGMVVYNNNVSLPAGEGLYAWNGSEWKSMSAGSANSCVPVTAEVATGKTRTNAKLTVTVTAGSPRFSYIWSKAGEPVQTITNVAATSDTYITTGADTYTVTVTNPCTATPISFTFTVDNDGGILTANRNGTFTNEEGQLVYNGKKYNPVESDVPGIYITDDANKDIIYVGADGIPENEDDNVFVRLTTPLPKQAILFSIVKPVLNGVEENTSNTQLDLDFSIPYSGKIKYISTNPSIISVDQNGVLTATANQPEAVSIVVILEDGSVTMRNFDSKTYTSMNEAGAKLVAVSPGKSSYLALLDSTIKIGVNLLAQNNTANVWGAQSVIYTMIDAGGTGSGVTQGGWFTAGSVTGTATVKAEVEDKDGAKIATTITVEVIGGTPCEEEAVYETVSTDWASLKPAPDYAGGDGTEANPYKISSLRQLKKLSYDIELMGGVEATYQKYYQLTTNLDFTNDYTVTQSLVNGTFYGSFNGLGHVIKGLHINAGNETVNYIGIISQVSYGEIKNLGREGGSTISTSGAFVGGLAGRIVKSIISNCFNTSNITAPRYLGGITGAIYYRSTIENCYNIGDILCSDLGAGGITGYVIGDAETTVTIVNAYNNGKVNAFNYAATLVGNMRNASLTMQTLELNNCYNFNNIDTGDKTNTRTGAILGLIQNGDPELTNIIATNVYTKPNTLILNGVPTNRLIGWTSTNQKTNLVDQLIVANPTMKEDAKYTLDYSQSTDFVTELGGAFEYAPGRTPKLAWE